LVATPSSNYSTVTAGLGVNYLLTKALTGSILYTFTYQSNGGSFSGGGSGNVIVNQLQFVLNKAF
jgi:hypothetical protein